jgi:hypothetical protein
MTESPRPTPGTGPSATPQEGIAGALSDLTEQTRILVRREVESAQREMLGKLKASGPAAGLVAGAGFLGMLAAASSYRLSLRLLEKALPPATAALVATVGYGAAAGAAGVVAVRRLQELPPPLPTETAKDATATVAETAAQVSARTSG